MTMDNGMDVSPSWEELREERDALADKLAESDHALMQLGRLKATWQADAIWQFITEVERAGWETAPALVVNALYTRCAELRRQAEGPIK